MNAGGVPFGWRLLALLLPLPGVAWLVESQGQSWPLVLGAFLLPLAIGRRSDVRVWAVGVTWGFVLPLVPTLFGWLGFQPERVLVHGALAVLAWRGALRPAPTRSRLVLGARGLLLAWLAWSVGSALRAAVLNVPAGGAPWLGHALSSVLLRSVAPVSLVEPAFPLWACLLRAETVLLIWAGLEVGLRHRDAGRVLAAELARAVIAGLVISVGEYVQGSIWRGESVAARLAQGVPRSHRPLGDHNALGAAMLLGLPLLTWGAWLRWRERAPGPDAGPGRTARRVQFWIAALGLGAALFLLYTSRSKSAFGGLAVAAVLAALVGSLRLSRRARRLAWGGCGLALVSVVTLNLLPKSALDVLASTRRTEDLMRVFHLRPLRAYLEVNRYAIWSAGAAMGRSAPVFGVGLGNFPRRLADFRVPAEKHEFNPLHENAHDMFLQWWAEDGLVGLALALGIIALSLAACVVALRGPPREPQGDPASDALARTAASSCVPLLAALSGFSAALVVGHALLVPAVAILWASWTGLALAAGGSALLPQPIEDAERTGEARTLPPRLGAALPALGLVALLPLAWNARAPLEDWAVGCYPWLTRPFDTPDRARVLGPDARWMQRWGAGRRMILPVFDVRSGLEDRVQHLDVWLGDELVLENFPLPRKSQLEELNPFAYLKLDAPEGTRAGDLVPVRVESDVRWSMSLMHTKGYELVGPRHLPPVFR